MDAAGLTRRRKMQHEFHGEMRVQVNRRIHPNATPEQVQEMVGLLLEGTPVEGIRVTLFDARGKEVTGEQIASGEYAFASGFIVSATKTPRELL